MSDERLAQIRKHLQTCPDSCKEAYVTKALEWLLSEIERLREKLILAETLLGDNKRLKVDKLRAENGRLRKVLEQAEFTVPRVKVGPGYNELSYADTARCERFWKLRDALEADQP